MIELPATHAARSRIVGLALLVGLLGPITACKDKAKPAYDKCIALETEFELIKARDACREAAKLDPDSESGKAAKGKLASYLEPEAKRLEEEERKKTGPCKSGKWVTRCMWKGKPRPDLREANTKAMCNQEASQLQVIGMTCPDCVCKDYFKEPYAEEE